MTAIVAVKCADTGDIWMGADSEAGWGGRKFNVAESEPKIRIVETAGSELIMWAADGHQVVNEIINYHAALENLSRFPEDASGFSCVVGGIVPEIRAASVRITGNHTIGGNVLLAFRGNIFVIDGSLSVNHPENTLTFPMAEAIGSGGSIALGSVYGARSINPDAEPKRLVEDALKAAISFDEASGGSILIRRLPFNGSIEDLDSDSTTLVYGEVFRSELG